MDFDYNRRGNLIQFIDRQPRGKGLLFGGFHPAVEAVMREKFAGVDVAGSLRDIPEIPEGEIPEIPKEATTEISSGGYDFILFYGTAEGIAKCMADREESEIDVVGKLASLLTTTGQLAIAANNPFGLRYFAGCKGEATGEYFPAFATGKNPGKNKCSGSDKQEGFARPLLDKMAKETGLHARMYYPYPNIEFPVALYSDEYLPGTGELDENLCNFTYSRMQLFEEKDAFDTVVSQGLFPVFSNAYLLLLSKEEPFKTESYNAESHNAELPNESEQVIFTRYSNERREGFRIRTDIRRDACSQDPANRCFVRKSAYDRTSSVHIENLVRYYSMLQKSFEGTALTPNEIVRVHTADALNDGAVDFAFVAGRSFESVLDEYLDRGQSGQILEQMDSFFKMLRGLKQIPFEVTAGFTDIFGTGFMSTEANCLPVTDMDMIFRNILVDDTGKMHVIDYEWTFDFPIPLDYIIYRCIHFYMEEKNRKKHPHFPKDVDLYERAGISDGAKEQFEKMEAAFQKYVQGDCKLVRDVYAEAGKPVLPLAVLAGKMQALEADPIRVLFNEEKEAKLCIPPHLDEAGVQSFVLDFAGEAVPKVVKIQPGSEKSLIRIGLLQEDEDGSHAIPFITNGIQVTPITFVFDTHEPEIIIEEIPENTKRLHVSIQREIPEVHIMDDLSKGITELYSILRDRDKQIEEFLNSTSWKITKPLRKLRGNE